MSQAYKDYLSHEPEIDLHVDGYYKSYFRDILDQENKFFYQVDTEAVGVEGLEFKFIFESRVSVESSTASEDQVGAGFFTDPEADFVSIYTQDINFNKDYLSLLHSTSVYSLGTNLDDPTIDNYMGIVIGDPSPDDTISGARLDFVASTEVPDQAVVSFKLQLPNGDPITDWEFDVDYSSGGNIKSVTTDSNGKAEFMINANTIVNNPDYGPADPNPLKFTIKSNVVGIDGYLPISEDKLDFLNNSFNSEYTLWFEEEKDLGTITLDLTPVSTEIYDAEDLFNIRYGYTKDYRIMNNIDLENFVIPDHHPDYQYWKKYDVPSDHPTWIYRNFDGTGEFPPIVDFYGNVGGFEGSLDGKGYKIKNFLINQPNYTDSHNLSLFTDIYSATIKKFTMENLSILGDENLGAIAGYISGSALIEKVGVQGNITADGEGYDVGGISGWVNSSSAIIRNCYHIGDINNNGSYTGGICSDNSGTVEKCYHAGEVSSAGTPVGGIAAGEGAGIIDCYYDSDLITDTASLNSYGYPRTTAKMTEPYDESDTYIGWDFNNTWHIKSGYNNDYPYFGTSSDFNIMISGTAEFNFSFAQNISILFNLEANAEYYTSLGKAFSLDFEALAGLLCEAERSFPIVRTNFYARLNDRLYMSGTLLDPGPYEDELWDRDITGFFEIASDMFEFGTFSIGTISGITLPAIGGTLVSAELVNNITDTQTQIELNEMPDDFKITESGDYKYVKITDENKTEVIGYAETDGNYLKQIDRGLLNSNACDFVAGDTVYNSELKKSLTWEDDKGPIGNMTEYKYRAGIEVETKLSTTGDSRTFTFYAGARNAPVDDEEDPEDLDRGELFVDARDLETEDELFDRAKIKFEEMDFETWDLEEFKNWTWEEFKEFNLTDENFDEMTTPELIEIADGITEFDESDLVNQNTVTAESFISDVGNWVDLANNNIDTVTEVRDETSTALVEDTDFEIDYTNGKIKILDTTDTSDGASYEIDYTHGNYTREEIENIINEKINGIDMEELDESDYVTKMAELENVTEDYITNNYTDDEIEDYLENYQMSIDEISDCDYDISDLIARLITFEPEGVFDDWTELELDNFLDTILTDEYGFNHFEDNFAFEKWETIMKSRLEININHNASIEVEYNQHGPYNYLIDFQLGDIVVVEYPDVFKAMIRIIEVKEEKTPEGKKYTLTLGKEFNTLVGQIIEDKDDISGRL
ncbi:MAG TPA: hypothetical protein VJ962_02805 [Clostridia bacterium]|nr:hypothetical protein [Clostridia bacterium]